MSFTLYHIIRNVHLLYTVFPVAFIGLLHYDLWPGELTGIVGIAGIAELGVVTSLNVILRLRVMCFRAFRVLNRPVVGCCCMFSCIDGFYRKSLTQNENSHTHAVPD